MSMYIVHTYVLVQCTLALVECHKITCLTLYNMGIDIKTDDLVHFWDLATGALATGFLILARRTVDWAKIDPF